MIDHSRREGRILVVDREPVAAAELAEVLREAGHQVEVSAGVEQALLRLAEEGRVSAAPYRLVITDLQPGRVGGLDLLRRVRREHRAVGVLVISSFASIESAVEAVKLGAADYLTRPVVDEELLTAVEKALRQQALAAENEQLRRRLLSGEGLEGLVGADAGMRRIFQLIEAAAPMPTTVLLCGESGTGKSQIARAIHRLSGRSKGPFITFSCGAVPESLLESELFGHVRGAFSGAVADRPGRLEAAEGGTLFIDEINSASMAMQGKLLRVLQEKLYEPVGSVKSRRADVRFLAAGNEPLEKLVAEGKFREDLFYRVNVLKIDVPSLRDRPGDIPLLTEHFLRLCADRLGRFAGPVGREVMEKLLAYSWPGNVRELENAIEHALILSGGPTIAVENLPPRILDFVREPRDTDPADSSLSWLRPGPDGRPLPLEEALQEPEKQILLAALQANGWNRQQTARDLKIDRTTLYKKMKKHGLGG